MYKLIFFSFLLLAPIVGLAQSNNGLVTVNGTTVRPPVSMMFPKPAPKAATQAADDEPRITVTLGAHSVLNNPNNAYLNQALADKVGLDFGISYRLPFAKLDRLTFNARSSSNDNLPARTDYSATWRLTRKGVTFSPGGGFFRIGNDDGGFGELGIKYDEIHALAQFGSDQYVRAQVAYQLFSTPHFAFEPVANYTRFRPPTAAFTTRIFTIGVQGRFW